MSGYPCVNTVDGWVEGGRRGEWREETSSKRRKGRKKCCSNTYTSFSEWKEDFQSFIRMLMHRTENSL